MNPSDTLWGGGPVTTLFHVALRNPSVQECLEIVSRSNWFDYLTLSIVNPSRDPASLPSTWSTCPGGWITRYLRRSYALDDPVMQIGLNSCEPFFWSDLSKRSDRRGVLQDGARHGIGPCGYSIPHAANNVRSILSITSRSMADRDWRYYIAAISVELHDFTLKLHEKAVQELATEAAAGRKPAAHAPARQTARTGSRQRERRSGSGSVRPAQRSQ